MAKSAGGAGAGAGAGAGGVKRRRGAQPQGGGGSSSIGAAGAGILRFYSEDAPGLKIGPTTVLVLSLLFIGFVVLLHIWGKLTRS